jgi:hypothetical protein
VLLEYEWGSLAEALCRECTPTHLCLHAHGRHARAVSPETRPWRMPPCRYCAPGLRHHVLRPRSCAQIRDRSPCLCPRAVEVVCQRRQTASAARAGGPRPYAPTAGPRWPGAPRSRDHTPARAARGLLARDGGGTTARAAGPCTWAAARSEPRGASRTRWAAEPPGRRAPAPGRAAAPPQGRAPAPCRGRQRLAGTAWAAGTAPRAAGAARHGPPGSQGRGRAHRTS